MEGLRCSVTFGVDLRFYRCELGRMAPPSDSFGVEPRPALYGEACVERSPTSPCEVPPMQVEAQGLAAFTIAGALSHMTLAVVAMFALAVMIFAGVVLPAIWSAKPVRRKAAGAVLQQILDCVRRNQ